MTKRHLYLILLAGLICGFGCQDSTLSNDHSVESRQPFVDFESSPQKWKPGDSVTIALSPIWNAEGVVLSQAQFSMKASLGHVETIKYGTHSEVLIVPQSPSDALTDIGPDIEIVSSYSFPREGISIFLKEHYHIVEAGQGLFSFQKDSSFYQLDTISVQ